MCSSDLVDPGDGMEDLPEPVSLTPKSLVIVLDGVRPDALDRKSVV